MWRRTPKNHLAKSLEPTTANLLGATLSLLGELWLASIWTGLSS